MEHSTQASLLQAHATEQQRIPRSTRVDINVVLETVQGTQNPSHNLLRSARNIQPRPAKTPSVSPDPDYSPDDYWWKQYSELNLTSTALARLAVLFLYCLRLAALS